MKAAVLAHPQPDSLHKFGLGQLDLPESGVVETHVAGCAQCAATLQQVQDDTLLTLLRGLDSCSVATPTAFATAPLPAVGANSSPENQSLCKKSLPLGALQQLDAICEQFEHAWQQSVRPVLEEHLALVPEVDRPRLLTELLRLDHQHRQQNGETVKLSDYLPRLPKYEKQLRRFFSALESSPELPAEFRDHPRYRIVRLVGKGGMGRVYEAEHKRMGRQVALKVIQFELLNHAHLRQRFTQEVKAVSRLAHPNIVQAFDADQAGDLHFLIMEYVEGENLGDYLKAQGRLPSAEACDYVRQAALGLQHAYERGMTHRDIKPQNLMRQASPDGSSPPLVKILDFGLALIMDQAEEDSSAVTHPGMAMGTPDYISPEQTQDSHRVDIRSDIYSLGCTLYHFLTGQTPFPRGTGIQKMLKHSLEQPAPLSQLRPDLQPELVAVVEKMMAKNPADRFQIPAEVAAALAPFVDNGAAVTFMAGRPRAVQASAATAPMPVPALRPRRRKSWPMVLTTAAAFVLLGLGFLSLQGVFQVDTPNGPLVIKTTDPNIEITIRNNGEIVAITDTKSKQKWELDTKKLSLGMADQPGGLMVDLDKKKAFILKRDGKEVVTLTWVQAASPPGKEIQVLQRIPYKGKHILQTAVAPDGKFFAASFAQKLAHISTVWDGQTGKELYQHPGSQPQFTPNGKLFITEQWGLLIHEAATGKLFRKLVSSAKDWGYALLPDSRHVIYWNAHTRFYLGDLESGQWLNSWPYQVHPWHTATDDGKFLLLKPAGAKSYQVWDLKENKPTVGFPEIVKYERIWSFLPGNKKVVVVEKGKDYVIDVADGKLAAPIPPLPETGIVVGGRGCLDCRIVWRGFNDGTIRLFDWTTGQQQSIFHLPDGENLVSDFTLWLSPDARFACVASERAVYLLRLPDPPNFGPPGGKK